MGLLFLAFIALPLIEIGLFVQIGSAIGLGATLAFVVLSFALGVFVIRMQGMRAVSELRRAASGAADPTEPLAQGALGSLAGILLILPGFLTSACGLLLLVPAVRSLILKRLSGRVQMRGFGYTATARRAPEDDVIDGDFHEVPPGSLPRHPSGWTRN